MAKTPVPDRRPMFAQAKKGGDANQTADNRRQQPDKPQPRPSEGGAHRPKTGVATTGDNVALNPSQGTGLRPKGEGLPVVVRLQPDPLARLDAYRGGKTRPHAIREILEEKLP